MDSDAILLKQYAATRDAEAFSLLARRYAGLVYGTCLRITRNPADAEDAAQECFLELARRAGTIRSLLPGWLHATARTRALMAIRSAARRRRHEQQAISSAAADPQPAWDQIAPHVDDAIAHLPGDLRLPILLHFFQGLTQTQVAEELDISQSTVSARLETAIAQLRDRLEQGGVLASAAGLAACLTDHTRAAAPATLTDTLARMALSGISAPAGAATAFALLGSKFFALAAALILAAGVFLYSSRSGPAKGSTMATQPASAPSGIVREPNRVYIAGLEQAAWGNATERQNSTIAATAAAMQALGQNLSYEQLMGFGAAAFRIQHGWCPSSPHAECGQDCLSPALAAVGYSVTSIDVDHAPDPAAGAERARKALIESIDRGVPALWVNEECGLVVGYTDNGATFLLRPYSPSKPGYTASEKRPWCVGILTPAGSAPPRRQAVLASFQRAITMAYTPKVGIYHSGFAAYDAWATDLETGRFASPFQDVTDMADLTGDKLFAACLGNGFTYGCLADARRAAGIYLRGVANDFPPATADHITKAAAIYQQMDKTLWTPRPDLPYPWALQPWNLDGGRKWTPASRRTQAAVLRELAALDKQAIGELELALKAEGLPATLSTPP